jgi:glycosyltransferase involved in cell wall biosynthesis
MQRVKVLVVTNFAPHYRAPFFERLARAIDVQYIFFSSGTEQYWQTHLGTTDVGARNDTIVGRPVVAGLNYNPRLAREIWRRDYDVLVKCINGRTELASAYAIAKARRKPFVFWTTIWWNPVTALGQASLPFLQAVYKGADSIITDGDQVSRFVAGHGVDPGKIFTAELAIDNQWFMRPVPGVEREARRALLGAADRPLVLAVSRLVPEKGLDMLVRAAALLADLRPVVAVVGTGPLGAELDALACDLGVELRLVGGLKPAEMPALFAAADVYCMPSVTTPAVREPWGLGVNEAHCQRVPAVVSDAVGAAAGGLVVHGETGLVVPERDDRALALALRRVLGDREFGDRLAAAGRERVGATDYDAMVASFVAAIDYAVTARAGDGAALAALRSVRFRPPPR